MSEANPETGTPERLGKWVGDILSALVALAVLVMMIKQFA